MIGSVGNAWLIPGGCVPAVPDDPVGGWLCLSPQAAINAAAAPLPSPSSASRRKASRLVSRSVDVVGGNLFGDVLL